MDQIIIKGLRADVKHGATPQEKMMGQELEIDVTLECDLSQPCTSDNPEDTIPRKELVKAISDWMKDGCCNLMEYLADQIAQRLLEKYPQIKKVEIYLKQAQIPIYADFDYLAVRIERWA